MESSVEPILDVVRALSTIASVNIIVSQARNFYRELFRSPCGHCRGAGTVICRHCHGTKLRRSYPIRGRGAHQSVRDHPNLKYECYHCGPYALNDFDYDKEDDDQEAWNIMDNLKAAMANKPRPHPHKPVAGTVACPMCQGQCVLYRHTPDFASFFKMRGSWMDQIRARKVETTSDWSQIEYAEEILTGEPPKLPRIKKKMPNIRGLEGRSIEEVVLPYVDDSDTTASSGDEREDYFY